MGTPPRTSTSDQSIENLRSPASIPPADLRKLDDTTTPDVVGTTRLFDGEDGALRFVPMPTPDPSDPLNLPTWRKWLAVLTLSFFGALALASEFIIGALVPVFVLEYNGIDPKILSQIDFADLAGGTGGGGGVNFSPLSVLAGLGGPPVYQVALLASLPMLMNGVASYLLVPLSIAVGRRPVLLAVGVMAWAGGFGASFSNSLPGHLAARAFQGLGAGAVEALIPLVVQDMMFIHQRNKAIALISAAQGVFVMSMGIARYVCGWSGGCMRL